MVCKKCRIDKPYTKEYFYEKRMGDKIYLGKICKECKKKNQNIYRLLNKEKHNEWCSKNTEKLRERKRHYCRERRASDPIFKMVRNIRSRTSLALRQNWKSGHTMDFLGCTIDKLKTHLETKFQHGMSWENYGKWHIDHIKPCASFDLSKSEEQRKCFHHTNLQPLWAIDNRKKSNKINVEVKDE